MLTRTKFHWLVMVAATLCASAAMAQTQSLKEDNQHIRRWTQFADDVLALHKQKVAKHDVKIEKRVGGYFQQPEFYVEKKYYDRKTGRLLSIVQWEKENPDKMHSIEVYIHDDEGNVVRDYIAAYLPTYRNAPTQTLVSFHNYNDDLHAFRSFDASGYRVVERCKGTYQGKDVNFILDEDEIAEALDGYTDIMKTDKYQACFEGVPEKPGKYLQPQ
jgi:hypothetical protein